MSMRSNDSGSFSNMVLQAECPHCHNVMEENLYVGVKNGAIYNISESSDYAENDVERCFCEYTCAQCKYTFVLAAEVTRKQRATGKWLGTALSILSVVISCMLISIGWMGVHYYSTWLIYSHPLIDPAVYFVLDTLVGGTLMFGVYYLAWHILHMQFRSDEAGK